MENDRYEISVGEPWNYDGPDGPNLIVGRVLKITDDREIIFLADKELEFSSDRGRILILHYRYTQYRNFKQLHGLTVNGGLLLEEYDESLSYEELEKRSRFVVIGGLRKVD